MNQRNIFRNPNKNKTRSLLAWWQVNRGDVSEYFWGSCAFLLFLLSGPFCTPVVLLAMARLAYEAQQSGCREPMSL
ncbi:MAG: hypothetical protein GX087_09095 [Desulfobulbaceae bacterium]|nr:hypothetical protein [Desulfobulbaceae bacterium]